jgi:branched-chain amino acid aminotransferase
LIGELFDQAVVQRSVSRSELYVADEVLLCGTAATVVPVIAIDGRPVSTDVPGERTLTLQRTLLAIGRREEGFHPEWTTPVYRE